MVNREMLFLKAQLTALLARWGTSSHSNFPHLTSLAHLGISSTAGACSSFCIPSVSGKMSRSFPMVFLVSLTFTFISPVHFMSVSGLVPCTELGRFTPTIGWTAAFFFFFPSFFLFSAAAAGGLFLALHLFFLFLLFCLFLRSFFI